MILNVNDTDYAKDIALVRQRCEGLGYTAHVITFGCQQNEADSEKIRGMLNAMGYELSDSYENADVIIVNTCAIREHAEVKALSLLGNFKAIKRRNPNLIVGVVGCVAAKPDVAERLKKDFHYVTFTLEPNMLHKIPSLILASLEDGKRTFVIGEDSGDIVEGMPVRRTSGSRAWVSVMYGCNNFCSYCIVPYVRGRERSRNSTDIINECKSLVESGVNEITLLGQNVNSYQSDLDFAGLIDAIADIEGDFLIRFMTSHPKDVSDRLIEVMKRRSDKVAPYFHLPLQSGSDRILKEMNRTYNSERYLEVVRKLRAAVPGIALSTDVIVGFPGETEEDFENTMDVLREVHFDMVYSFLYSAREGTRAAKMVNTVPDDVKAERMNRLLAFQDNVSLECNLAYVGRTLRVLVESVSKKDKNMYTARTDTNKLVHFSSECSRIGEFITVKIIRAGAFDLFAEEIV